jgi:hypothetical protein
MHDAAAQEPSVSLAGRWQADPMTVRWVVGEWGEACGPRPSGGGDDGGVVHIEVKSDELVISGPDGKYSSDQCWAMHPELDRQSHAKGKRSWATTCRTKPNDARQEVLQTTITATNDAITFRESGQYQYSLQGQTCSASSGRWRSYRRLAEGAEPTPGPPSNPPSASPPQLEPELPVRELPAEAEPTPAPSAAPPAERAPRKPSNPCANPGAPARLEVRPARKLMRSGESFTFRAAVFDARGCALRAAVSWALEPANAAAKLENGLLDVAQGAPDAELAVVATVASQAVKVAVDVVSSERYAALLGSGAFTADGASIEAATATITSGSLGAQVAPEDGPPERKWTFVALVAGIALLFGLFGAYLLRRAQRKLARTSASEREPGTMQLGGGSAAPQNPATRPVGLVTRLEPVPSAPTAPRAATVCPVCGTLYPTRDLKSCPKDGAQLLPVNA